MNDPDLTGALKDVTMPFGPKNFVDKMEEYVPGSRESMEKFISLCEDLRRAVKYMMESRGNVDPKVMQREHANFLKCAPYSVETVLDTLKMPVKAKKILESYWCYIGVDTKEMDFFLYAMMTYRYLCHGACVPKNRSHAISVALAEKILEYGGEIWCNTKAEKIILKDGAVAGLVTSHGTVETNHLICCCSPHAVYGDMLDYEQVPEVQLRDVNSRKFGMRGLVAYVGLNKSYQELGLKDYSTFIYDSMDTGKALRDTEKLETNNVQATICLNVVNPTCSPEGTTIMSFTTFYGSDVWETIPPEDYVAAKRMAADRMFEMFAREVGIDIRPYIEEIEIATPLTLARYTLNPKGVMYAYAATSWDGFLPRIMMMSEESAIPGIRFAGAYGARVIGFSSTYACGDTVAKLTLGDLAKEVR